MTNILSQRWLLNRRHFLRGLGATMALPLLDAMMPLRARGRRRADKPRRSVFVYIPNGVNGMTWQVTKPGRDYELSPSLQAAGEASRRLHRLQRAASSERPRAGARLRRHLADRREDRCAERAASTRTPSRATSSWRRSRRPADAVSVAGALDQLRHRPAAELDARWPSPATACRCRRRTTRASVFDRLFGEEPGGIAAQRAALGQAPQRARCRARRRQIAAPRPRQGRPHQARRIPALRARRGAAHRAARLLARRAQAEGRQEPGRAVPAQCLQGQGRRILAHDVRPHRARPAHRHDARGHLHERQRRQRPGHPRDRHHPVPPQSLASQRRPRGARPPGQERRLHHAAVRALPRRTARP